MATKKILVFAILLLLGLLLLNHYQDTKYELSAKKLQQKQSKELSVEEFKIVKVKYLRMMNEKDPKFALGKLRNHIQKDNALLRSCHALVHEMGRRAYEKYGDFGEAMKYKDEICNSGYLHGIIETNFEKSPDVFTAMKSVCDPYPIGKYLSWECFHGVGHGVMYYTSNDLPKSLELCDKYESSFARKNCANGVFMENFNSDQKIHLSKFLKPADPFFPCPNQKTIYKKECYLYAPTYYLSLNKNNYTGALTWCNKAESDYKDICVQGVGSQAMKENINDSKFVEKVCMSGKASQTAPCISGMIGLYINHFGSLEEAQNLCNELKILNKNVCKIAIKSSASLF